jgi:hypothetical protein
MPKKQTKKKKEQPVTGKRVYDIALLAVFAVFLVLFTTNKLTNEDDYFWHLSTGRYIVQTGSIPSTDVFSFPTEGQHWLVTEWGWDVITYSLFSAFGYTGLSVLTTIIFLGIFASYIFILRKFQVSYTIIILFAVLLCFGIFERITPRPHIVTYLFFVLLMSGLIYFKYFNRSTKLIYFIPLMFLFWANMHMGCVIGIILFFVICAVEVVIYFYPAKFSSKDILPIEKKLLIRLLLIFLASGLAMLANPHGIVTYMYAASAQVNMKMLQEAIMEWISPFDPKIASKFHSMVYFIFLSGGISILYYAVKRKDLLAAVIFLLFAFNSLRALRFTVDYLFVVFVYSTVAASFVITSGKSAKKIIYESAFSKIIVSAVILLFIVTIPGNTLYNKYLVYARFFGIGIDKNYYPESMFNFIRDNNIQNIGERPFNTFECGGYFLWNFPGKKNFFDSRDLNDFIMNEYQTIISKLPGHEKKIEDYNFDYAICVIPDIASEPQIMKMNVISYFAKNPDKWKLVFWNDRSLLFVRNSPKFQNIIDNYEYKLINPYNFYFQKNLIDNNIKNSKDIFFQELKRKQMEEPQGIFINTILRAYRSYITN